MPADSVRGRIRTFLEGHAHLLGGNVLEVGSRLHNPDAWYINNRDLAEGLWLGIDMQPGTGVDMVADIEALDMPTDHFSGILCSEVLEHVKRPWKAVPELARVLAPGGHILITTLTTFHIHGYPDDYYRYTESGLRLLLEDAGLTPLGITYAGDTVLELKNHDERVFRKRAPLQIFAVARK